MRLNRRTVRWWLLSIVVALLLTYVFSRLASPWRRIRLHSSSDSQSEFTTNDPLRIACYNIAHGRGTATSNWEGGSASERLGRLDDIASTLRSIDADVVVLNEVDFDCSWSNSINQARYLAHYGGYPYWVEERNLDFRVLIWKWKFGNAILSKFPIVGAREVDLPGYARWETLLAGKKRGLLCNIRVDDRQIQVVGTHLSHRDESLRVKSASVISTLAATSRLATFVAGDLNSTPNGFPGWSTDSHGANAIDVLDQSAIFLRHPESPPTDKSDYTFHSANPASVIDWILVPRGWRLTDRRVHASQLSDHRLVYIDVVPDAAP